MSDQMEKIAELTKRLEAKTDYYGARLLAWPYSWVVVSVVVALATYGAIKLVS